MISSETFADLSILNCNEGDISVSFDETDPIELARAKRIVEDDIKVRQDMNLNVYLTIPSNSDNSGDGSM